jgi:hypothetical protein
MANPSSIVARRSPEKIVVSSVSAVPLSRELPLRGTATPTGLAAAQEKWTNRSRVVAMLTATLADFMSLYLPT